MFKNIFMIIHFIFKNVRTELIKLINIRDSELNWDLYLSLSEG